MMVLKFLNQEGLNNPPCHRVTDSLGDSVWRQQWQEQSVSQDATAPKAPALRRRQKRRTGSSSPKTTRTPCRHQPRRPHPRRKTREHQHPQRHQRERRRKRRVVGRLGTVAGEEAVAAEATRRRHRRRQKHRQRRRPPSLSTAEIGTEPVLTNPMNRSSGTTLEDSSWNPERYLN